MELIDTYRGLTVCDLSQGVAAPHATMLLAQFGANVIKVEPPAGDWARQLGEPLGDHCIHSWQYNLGKRSVVLDLKSASDKRALLAILESADVFVESFRPGVAARLGVSYDDVRRVQPSIIYTSMSGFGQAGPYSQRGTVDTLIQGFSGMMMMNRTPDGKPHRQGMIAVDVLAGLYLYGTLTTALARRAATGQGCFLDVNLMQAAAAFQSAKIAEYHHTGGSVKPLYMPSGLLPARDGMISLSTMREEHFALVCKALNATELQGDSRFCSAALRLKNGSELMTELAKYTSSRAVDDLLNDLHSAGVLSERVQSYAEWMTDPHVLATNAYDWVKTASGETLPLVRLPGVESGVPHASRHHAPSIGEHTEQILGQYTGRPEGKSLV